MESSLSLFNDNSIMYYYEHHHDSSLYYFWNEYLSIWISNMLFVLAFLPIILVVAVNSFFILSFLWMNISFVVARKRRKEDDNNNTKRKKEKDSEKKIVLQSSKEQQQEEKVVVSNTTLETDNNNDEKATTKKESTTFVPNENDDDDSSNYKYYSLPSDILVDICSYLHPESLTRMACVNRASNDMIDGRNNKKNGSTEVSHAVWKSIWFRYYGTVLLEWEVSRLAIWRSINDGGESNDTTTTTNNNEVPSMTVVLHRLQEVLGESISNMRTFYFEFQQCYMDYVLKGCNTPSQCYMGLHGHILDFTKFAPYHPGLSEPIVVECGRDVTTLFEEIRHSRTARKIGRKLCVLLDRSCCTSAVENTTTDTDTNNRVVGCGLRRVNGMNSSSSSSSRMKQRKIIRTTSDNNINNNNNNTTWSLSDSNSRPPPSDNNDEIGLLDQQIFPMYNAQPSRKPYTLQKIRTQFEGMAQQKQAIFSPKQKRQSSFLSFLSAADTTTDDPLCHVRVYYDPFHRRWKGWYTDANWNTIYLEE